jgi:hypothetical protein
MNIKYAFEKTFWFCSAEIPKEGSQSGASRRWNPQAPGPVLIWVISAEEITKKNATGYTLELGFWIEFTRLIVLILVLNLIY